MGSIVLQLGGQTTVFRPGPDNRVDPLAWLNLDDYRPVSVHGVGQVPNDVPEVAITAHQKKPFLELQEPAEKVIVFSQEKGRKPSESWWKGVGGALGAFWDGLRSRSNGNHSPATGTGSARPSFWSSLLRLSVGQTQVGQWSLALLVQVPLRNRNLVPGVNHGGGE